ncbi:Fc.00g005410.m01.CDS01 [Cosmosporella sp. VM-42]
MRPVECPLPPSSSLPPLCTLNGLTEDEILFALKSLSTIYCPFSASLAFGLNPATRKSAKVSSTVSTPFVDSGYTSETEDDNEDLEALRADAVERAFAERWVTGFISRAAELPCLSSEDSLQRALDQASYMFESFYTSSTNEDQQEDEDAVFTREFSFKVLNPKPDGKETSIEVRINDGLAGRNSADPDDVGLQSWGASIVLSNMLCNSPARFGLIQDAMGSWPRIIELGAGTGLISLVVGSLLPKIGVTNSMVIATDYHPAVLTNLRSNIATNFPSQDPAPVETCLLDWSAPLLEPPLDASADMLIATDVVYAPEHAVWLCECSTRLLAPEGIFWLVATVRLNGKFEGISDTVEAAFTGGSRPRGKDGRRLTIMDIERIEKRTGIGRGDESGYKLFRIGWA